MSEFEIPDDRRYTPLHLWIKKEEEAERIYAIGLTRYAHEQLVGPTFVDLPSPGHQVEQGELFGCIQCLLGALKELYAPVSGEIVAVNQQLIDNPEDIAANDDPYGNGWLVKMRPNDPASIEMLLSARGYAERTEYAQRWGYAQAES